MKKLSDKTKILILCATCLFTCALGIVQRIQCILYHSDTEQSSHAHLEVVNGDQKKSKQHEKRDDAQRNVFLIHVYRIEAQEHSLEQGQE